MNADYSSLVVRCPADANVRLGSKADLSAGRIDVCFAPVNGQRQAAPAAAPHQLRDRQNERSFTLLLVRSGSVPKAIEFFLDRPADVPTARSKLVETLEVVGALGRR